MRRQNSRAYHSGTLQSFSGYTHAAADQLEAHLAGVTVIESGGALLRAAKKPLKQIGRAHV